LTPDATIPVNRLAGQLIQYDHAFKKRFGQFVALCGCPPDLCWLERHETKRRERLGLSHGRIVQVARGGTCRGDLISGSNPA
jgi:hypothetical protein